MCVCVCERERERERERDRERDRERERIMCIEPKASMSAERRGGRVGHSRDLGILYK